MRAHDADQNEPVAASTTTTRRLRSRGMGGQSMVEYVLIAVLISIALAAAITLTGPAVGNIFSNTVYNVLGQTTTPYKTLNAQTISAYQQAVASFTYATFPFQTNTPAAATCSSNPGHWSTIGPTDQFPPTYAINC